MKIGDLVRLCSGEYGTIVRGPYTSRFINTSADRGMIDNGMEHLAGSYMGAVDIINHKTGKRARHSLSGNSFEVISEAS